MSRGIYRYAYFADRTTVLGGVSVHRGDLISSRDNYFSFCRCLTNFGAHFQFKKVLEISKSGPKAPKIQILLSLPIFEKRNEIENDQDENHLHVYLIPKWYYILLWVA